MDLPRKTLAAWIFEYGGPEKLTVGEHDLPPLGPNDVLVRNLAASVTGFDVKYRSGKLAKVQLPGRAAFPLPQQLGRDAAGEIVAVGINVKQFAPGDRVVGVTAPENPFSPESIRGVGNLSKGIPIPGHQSLGSYAQYLVRDEHMWLKLPPQVDMEQAGVMMWPFSTSHRIVHDRLGVRLGDVVLITGASGGMGQATMQLAKLSGGQVIATTRKAEQKAELLRLGADAVVVTEDQDKAREEIMSFTGDEGVDHVVDYTGNPELLAFCKNVLRLGGRFVITTEQGQADVPFKAAELIGLEMSLVGIRGARMIDAITVLKLLAEDKVHTEIAAQFSLRKVADAHAMLESSSGRIGRIVLLPWAE